MKNHCLSVWLSMLAVLLAAGCFLAASHFHGRYVSTSRAVSRAVREAKSRGETPGASVAGLASPDKYLRTAWWMFYASVAVWVFAVVVAAKGRRRANWVAVLMVAALALAIPFGVLWVI